MLFDITNKESAIKTLSELTGINKIEINKFYKEYRDGIFNAFIKNFDINAKALNNNIIDIAAIHITTSNNECAEIKKYGLWIYRRY